MSFTQPTSISKTITDFLPSGHLLLNTIKWRDQDPTIVRKVVAGAGLALSGLLSLIDCIASLALTIITSPALFFGSNIPSNFQTRTMTLGLFAGISLTIAEFENITAKSLNDAIDNRLP